jgi:DNA-binding NarL/FixJ family response regulator
MGLVYLLRQSGITVLAAVEWPEHDRPSMFADAMIIDADMLVAGHSLASVTGTRVDTPVLVVNTERSALPDLLDGGAAAVVEKGESGDRIVEAVRSVVRGGRVVASAPSPIESRIPRPREAEHDIAERTLSSRESQVLAQIARGLTHGQIATRLGISPHTVDTYVKRIRTKLGVGNKAELTRFALLCDTFRTDSATA